MAEDVRVVDAVDDTDVVGDVVVAVEDSVDVALVVALDVSVVVPVDETVVVCVEIAQSSNSDLNRADKMRLRISAVRSQSELSNNRLLISHRIPNVEFHS